MKKLSLLIAMILCVTIGGVYAAWAYSDPNAKIQDATAEILVTMDDATKDGAQGTFNATANFKIKIDPLADVDPTTEVPNANHVTAIQFYERGENGAVMLAEDATITLTFTPSPSADMDIKANGPTAYYYLIDSTAVLDANNTMKYEGENIFTYSATKTNMVTIDWGTPDADGVFTVVLKAKDLISLTQNFLLGDLDAHATFQASLSGNIKFVVTETAAR